LGHISEEDKQCVIEECQNTLQWINREINNQKHHVNAETSNIDAESLKKMSDSLLEKSSSLGIQTKTEFL
jgi:hypothetical protein